MRSLSGGIFRQRKRVTSPGTGEDYGLSPSLSLTHPESVGRTELGPQLLKQFLHANRSTVSVSSTVLPHQKHSGVAVAISSDCAFPGRAALLPRPSAATPPFLSLNPIVIKPHHRMRGSPKHTVDNYNLLFFLLLEKSPEIM